MSRQESSGRSYRTAPDSHVNYRFLSSPEKTERLRCLHTQQRHMRLSQERLKAKLNKVIEKKGVAVDDEMHTNLQQIMQEKSSDMAQAFPEDSFGRLFWDQQQKAARLKNA